MHLYWALLSFIAVTPGRITVMHFWFIDLFDQTAKNLYNIKSKCELTVYFRDNN